MAYLAVAAFTLLLHMVYKRTSSSSTRNIIWIFSCAVVLLLVGLRSYYTGNDTIQYVRLFTELKYYSYATIATLEYRDLGFYYLVKTIGLFTSSPTVFLLVTAFLSLIGVFVTARKYSDYPVLVLFFYITIGNYMFAFTGIRQAIAMSLCLLSLRFVEKRKLIPFLIFVLLGAAMHHSAVMFLPTYFLARRAVNTYNLLLAVIVTVTVYFFYDRLLEIANALLNYDYDIEETDNGLIFYAILLVILGFAFLYRQFWIKDERQQIAMNMGIICAVIWTFRLIGRTAERPSMYWLNMIPVVLTNSLLGYQKESRLHNGQLVIFIAVLLAFLLFYKRVWGMPYALFI